MSMRVHWSDNLENMADGLFNEWAENKSIFERTCIVVRDMATRDWLKSYYLLNGKYRQVLMNLVFIPIEELANNWLFAKTHDEPLNTRAPLSHPYAKPVLTWRIYRILSDEEHLERELEQLKEYVGSDAKNAPRRRFELATQIAKLYDDYLNSRFALLFNWENGDNTEPDGVPAWQRILYQRLVQEDKNTYASDYYKALVTKNTQDAVANGFPQYHAIHIFDVPEMPEPTFRLLEKMSEEMEITFWSFNPCGDWLVDTPTRKSAIRELMSTARKALQNGENPPDIRLDAVFDTPRERLLGTLATGTRAVLGAQIDCDWVSPDSVLGEPGAAFDRLNRTQVAVHSCYSPRRELEAVHEGLHDFFMKHPDAKPHEALVLCGDWENYAPIIEAVFNSSPNQKGFIPISVAGGISGDTPISRSFNDLLAFRENRFEVSAVFALLGVPAIRTHFGLDENQVDTLQDMVKKANIHWGLDDNDVNTTIGMENGKSHYPFTWRRGLDRLALDMLFGVNNDSDKLVDAKGIGELLPTGSVEGDRAKALMHLNSFIGALAQVRAQFASSCSCTSEEWQKRLLEVVGLFYEDTEETLSELKRIRTAIQKVHDSATTAQITEEIPADVFVSAVVLNIRNTIPGSGTAADAVVFAPLKSASATPHRFIWICGLNDGAFPHLENRPSIDVIGKHPSPFDVSPRDRDGLALLKAVLSVTAGNNADGMSAANDAHTCGELVLSYVGKDIRTNEKVPPSVLLNELVEYLQKTGNVPMLYEHPLQSYSPRYFKTDEKLPPSYSASDYQVASALVGKASSQSMVSPADTDALETAEASVSLTTEAAKNTRCFCAFELNENGETAISADDLADFFSHPNNYLIKKRLNLSTTWIAGFEDDDAQTVDLDKHQKTRLILDETITDEEKTTLASVIVERGKAPDAPTAKEEIQAFCLNENTQGIRTYPLKFQNEKKLKKGRVLLAKAEDSCNMTLVDAYKDFLANAKPLNLCVELEIEGKVVRIPFIHRSIALMTVGGPLEHTFYMENASKIYPSTPVACWIRHLIGQAAGLKYATVIFCQANGAARTFRPMLEETAKSFLEKYLRLALAPLPQELPDYEKTSPTEDTAEGTPFEEVLLDANKYTVSTSR